MENLKKELNSVKYGNAISVYLMTHAVDVIRINNLILACTPEI